MADKVVLPAKYYKLVDKRKFNVTQVDFLGNFVVEMEDTNLDNLAKVIDLCLEGNDK